MSPSQSLLAQTIVTVALLTVAALALGLIR